MPNKSGMMAAVAAAAGLAPASDDAAVKPTDVTAALVAEHFPDAAKDLRAEGAKAERDRVSAIDEALIPGHEAIIAAHKADPTKSGADAARAVIAAENAAIADRKASLDADENKVNGLKSSATGKPADDTAEPTAAKTMTDAREIRAKATKYKADQAALGNHIDDATAVAHVTK